MAGAVGRCAVAKTRGLVLMVLLGCAGVALAQAPAGAPHLGKVYFQASCSAEAQPLLDKGLALLHSFQYKEARQTFEQAQAADGQCAMAHWGKAMSLWEQLWSVPDEKQIQEGREEIAEAQKLHPGTAKEQGFLVAAAAFYRDNAKLTHTDRIKAYAASMEQLHKQMPDDVEVGAFTALGLVVLADNDDDVNGLEEQKKAIAILNPLFEKYPDHPGVAHYLIHAADRPELAPEGLAAARRYAEIAPDSAHAIHMPSHIFVRLGLWQDSINSNLAAWAVARRAAEEHRAEAHYQIHAMDFLTYSYLQTGQEAKAREVIAQLDQVVGADEASKAQHRAYFEAVTTLDLNRWKEAAGLKVPAIRRDEQDSAYWARAIGAARSGDVAGAQASVQHLAECVQARQDRARKEGYKVSAEKATDLREAEAWLAYAQGKTEEALNELRAAAAHEEKNGSDGVIIPAREMLADMLLEMKRNSDALAEYSVVLKNAPNRFDALLGAGRSARAMGDSAGAQVFYAKLAENCPGGADRPELNEAKTIAAKRQ